MTEIECWKDVPGWEGYYQVSDLGRVKSLSRKVKRSRCGSELLKERLMSLVFAGNYLAVTLSRANRTKRWYVHRLVLTAFVGEPGPGLECCHADGDKTNNTLTNLRWDTRSANNRDRILHGADHNAAKTHCIHGHEFTPENIYWRRHGGRNCKACALANASARSNPSRSAA